ncbi:MAG: hypothetical protein PVJ19_19885, partial [Desulfobacteraceae bacterium]
QFISITCRSRRVPEIHPVVFVGRSNSISSGLICWYTCDVTHSLLCVGKIAADIPDQQQFSLKLIHRELVQD